MATRYLIMLAADARAVFGDEDVDLTARQRRRLKRFRNADLRLGDPLIERARTAAGALVSNRRVLWAHDFDAAFGVVLPDQIRTIEFEDGESAPMQLTSTFPANWRFPAPTP